MAVIDDGFDEILSVALQIHLLEEVSGEIDALVEVGAQFELVYKRIALLYPQHLMFLQRFQLNLLSPMFQVKCTLVWGDLEVSFECFALFFEIEYCLQFVE